MAALITPKQSTPLSDPPVGGDPAEAERVRRRLASKAWWSFFSSVESAVNANAADILTTNETIADLIQYGTSASRTALVIADLPPGAIFIESDRNEIVYQLQGASWRYVSGTYARTQSQLAALAATLTASDAGFLVNVTDYAHVLEWGGAFWQWGPGEARDAGQIAFFDVDPGAGWKILDGLGDNGGAIGAGNPIKILKSDGTTRDNITAAAMNAGVFLRGAAAYNGAVTAATVPTLTGDTASGTANIQNNVTATAATAGGPNVAAFIHTHADAGHTHGVGTLAVSIAGGDPVAFVDALPYLRK